MSDMQAFFSQLFWCYQVFSYNSLESDLAGCTFFEASSTVLAYSELSAFCTKSGV
jgi:hypothetical protein